MPLFLVLVVLCENNIHFKSAAGRWRRYGSGGRVNEKKKEKTKKKINYRSRLMKKNKESKLMTFLFSLLTVSRVGPSSDAVASFVCWMEECPVPLTLMSSTMIWRSGIIKPNSVEYLQKNGKEKMLWYSGSLSRCFAMSMARSDGRFGIFLLR